MFQYREELVHRWIGGATQEDEIARTMLQKSSTRIDNAQDNFEPLTGYSSEKEDLLKATTDIAHSPDFESATAKVQGREKFPLHVRSKLLYSH